MTHYKQTKCRRVVGLVANFPPGYLRSGSTGVHNLLANIVVFFKSFGHVQNVQIRVPAKNRTTVLQRYAAKPIGTRLEGVPVNVTNYETQLEPIRFSVFFFRRIRVFN